MVNGGRFSYDMDSVEDSVDIMLRVADETEYDKGLRYMYYLLDGFDEQGDLPVPVHPLLRYFLKNWDSCKDMWAAYARSGLAHLGNNTNNRCTWSNSFGIVLHFFLLCVLSCLLCIRLEASWGDFAA
jgi:hypothetical protein